MAEGIDCFALRSALRRSGGRHPLLPGHLVAGPGPIPNPVLLCWGSPLSPDVPRCPCWCSQGWAASPLCLQITGGFPGTTTCSPPSAPRVRRELLHLCHVSKPGASPLSDRRADGSSSPLSMSPCPLTPTGLSVQWGQEPRAGVARRPQALPAAASWPSANRAHSIDFFFFPFFLFPRSLSIKIKAVLSPLVAGPGAASPQQGFSPNLGCTAQGTKRLLQPL